MRVATHYFNLHDVMPQKPGSLITIIAKYLLRHKFAIPMSKKHQKPVTEFFDR